MTTPAIRHIPTMDVQMSAPFQHLLSAHVHTSRAASRTPASAASPAASAAPSSHPPGESVRVSLRAATEPLQLLHKSIMDKIGAHHTPPLDGLAPPDHDSPADMAMHIVMDLMKERIATGGDAALWKAIDRGFDEASGILSQMGALHAHIARDINATRQAMRAMLPARHLDSEATAAAHVRVRRYAPLVETPPQAAAEIRAGRVYHGLVSSVQPYGAFIEFEPGETGLLHVSQIIGSNEGPAGTIFQHVRQGQSLQVKLLQVDQERRRYILGTADGNPLPLLTTPVTAD